MNYLSSITVDQIIDALAAFIQPFVGAAQIVRGQGNRVPMPSDPCIVLTELLQVDLSMPSTSYDPAATAPTAVAIVGPTRIDIQIDFYDGSSSEFCKVIAAALRSSWGFDQFPAFVKPLYTSEGVQAPLVTGEQQYESRWTLTASLQYNPVVTVPQQFSNTLSATVELPADLA